MNIDSNIGDRILFCPNCGKQNVEIQNEQPNYNLYVAEDCGDSTEYYDSAVPFECLDCGTHFYIGDN